MTIIKKLNRILDKGTKIKLIILLCGIIAGGLLETLALTLIAPFLALLLNNTLVESNTYLNWVYNLFGFENVSSLLALLTFALAAIYVFKGVYLFLLERAKIRFIARRQAACAKRLLSKLLDFSYLYHTHKNVAEKSRIIGTDVGHLFAMLFGILVFLADLFTTLFMMAYLFYESPVMTACVLGLTLFCAAVYFVFFRNQIQKAGKTNRSASIEISKSVLQVFGGIKEVKVMQREKYFEKVYVNARDRFIVSDTRFKVLNILPRYTLEIICFGGAFSLVSIFILAGADLVAIVPQLGLFVMAAFKILPAVNRQVAGINTILFHRASVDAVYNNLFEEKDIASTAVNNEHDEYTCSASTSGVEIYNLSFTYPNAVEPVLEKVSFTIPENKSVAFVGPSGVGKTTLADLILGILTPDAGTVLYQGKPICNNALWSKSIGYIPQQIYLLDESILANVAFGLDKKDIDMEKVHRALEQAQLKDFVETLPDGINTIVGDRGVRLSGGQRQRIGIARAIYEDPPVLILDEATSSLDTETEQAVMEAIEGFHGNKTILIIAHRLSTIEYCDIVYRVEDKKVTRER